MDLLKIVFANQVIILDSKLQFPQRLHRSSSLRVLLCILLSVLVESGAVHQELTGDLWFLRRLPIGIRDQLNQHFYDEVCVERWHPAILDSLCADLPGLGLDVGMVDLGDELHVGALEGIVVAEVHIDNEGAALVWRACRPLYLDIPVDDAILHQVDGDSRHWIAIHIIQLLRQPLLLPCLCHLFSNIN